ncbi:MAG: hypothetical protein M3P96_05700 [Actinomycetota bacterium]|nr:hypothetical protein [Actinomycetota bacterium]
MQGLQTSLNAATAKMTSLDRAAATASGPIDLGIPMPARKYLLSGLLIA